MGPRLVDNLVDAGLVTPSQAEMLPVDDGAAGGSLARTLIESGLAEDALAGFFVARGFGPVLDFEALSRGDGHLRRRLGADNARHFVALPLRSSPAGVIVAMADPTDARVVDALRLVFEQDVLPTVARCSDLDSAIEAAFPGTDAEELAQSGPVELAAPRHDIGAVPLTRAKNEQAEPEELVSSASEVWDKAWSQSLAAAKAQRNHTPADPLPTPGLDVDVPSIVEQAPAPQTPPPPEPLAALAGASLPVPPADHSEALARIDAAQSRDDVIVAACEGVTRTAQSAAFLVLRKGVLRGWHGCGEGLAEGSIQSLWVPATNPSMLGDVLQANEATCSAYGTTAADQLFRAAMGGHGASVAVAPVFIGQKVIGLLCAADPTDDVATVVRFADAVGDGFRRLIVTRR